ncbi:hypothetical protein DV515_00010584 [Chloebia gouldiae]|uniref:Uncharacterized protein n=1 Tax=Chloebia gouldiae TaxID=44316 RepID=A0A3L8S9J1_CHLGU|nr:hypothetical protein DV515_00010584 [Chloebia gouldiae]
MDRGGRAARAASRERERALRPRPPILLLDNPSLFPPFARAGSTLRQRGVGVPALATLPIEPYWSGSVRRYSGAFSRKSRRREWRGSRPKGKKALNSSRSRQASKREKAMARGSVDTIKGFAVEETPNS